MELYSWTLKGNLYLWRYKNNPKNYKGWHFTGDRHGLASLCDLLNLMSKEEQCAKCTIRLAKPTETELSISGCNDRALKESKVVLHFETDNPVEWSIKPYGDSMDIIMSPHSLKGFRESLQLLLRGRNDFSFGYGENKIWFW